MWFRSLTLWTRLPLALLVVALVVSSAPFWAENPAPDDFADLDDPAAELIERERIRSGVDDAFRVMGRRTDNGGVKNDNFVLAATMLRQLGNAAVPYLESELEQARPGNYSFVAYALGRVGTPDAEAALRADMARAEASTSGFALVRKAWSGYGLALMGKADVLDLLNDGDHLSGRVSIHYDTSVTELAALFSPREESLPRLFGQLEHYAEDEMRTDERTWTLRALRRLGDPSAVPKIIPAVTDPAPYIRRDACLALAPTGTPEAIAALIRALKEDDEPSIRFAAASALEKIRPVDQLDTFVAQLELETNAHVRGVLYRLVARLGGSQGFKLLRQYWGAPNPQDRAHLVRAAILLDDPRATILFREALLDIDGHVEQAGIDGLARVGGRDATGALIERLTNTPWVKAQRPLGKLVELGESRAAPRISQRMLKEMEINIVDPHVREQVTMLGDALLALRQTEALPALRSAAERQRDGFLVRYLEQFLKKLELVAKHGDDVDAWIELTGSADQPLRILAYERLGEIGDPKAVPALRASFGRLEVDEGVELLRAIGKFDTEGSRALLRRVLTDPVFDPFERLPLRDMAAWSARSLGGDEMKQVLRESVERRQGRDAKVLVYLLQLGGREQLELFERVRVERMQFMKWTRGTELDKLDHLAREVRAGRTVTELDQPPERISFDPGK